MVTELKAEPEMITLAAAVAKRLYDGMIFDSHEEFESGIDDADIEKYVYEDCASEENWVSHLIIRRISDNKLFGIKFRDPDPWPTPFSKSDNPVDFFEVISHETIVINKIKTYTVL